MATIDIAFQLRQLVSAAASEAWGRWRRSAEIPRSTIGGLITNREVGRAKPASNDDNIVGPFDLCPAQRAGHAAALKPRGRRERTDALCAASGDR